MDTLPAMAVIAAAALVLLGVALLLRFVSMFTHTNDFVKREQRRKR